MNRAVIVKSCKRYRDRRHACEQTWAGSLRASGVPVFFLEAAYPGESDENVIATLSGDTYVDNSIKLQDGLRQLLRMGSMCQPGQIFICDDNTFVQHRRWLNFIPQSDFVGLHDPPKIPWCHGGAGWWMSRRACELYVAGVNQRCSWDDKLASEILAKHGIQLENHPELFAQWDERVAADNQLITCHNVDPAEMVSLFHATDAL